MKVFAALIAWLILVPAYGESLIVGSFNFSIDVFSNTEIYRSKSLKGSELTAVLRKPGNTPTPNDEKIIIQAIEVTSGGFTGGLEEILTQMSRGSGDSIGSMPSSIPKKIELGRGLVYRSTFCDAEKIRGRCATVLYFLENGIPIRRFMVLTIFTNSVNPPTDENVIQKLDAINFEPPDF